MMKNALITGGTKGIGLGIAKMLLSLDYHVILTYAHDESAVDSCTRELSEISSEFNIIKASQGNEAEMNCLKEFLHTMGHVDCVVCNAGTTLRKDLLEMTDDEWREVMEINVNSNVFLIRDLFTIIPENSRIIFIGSLMAIHPHGISLAYGVTKSAVHALAKNLVKVFEGTNTTVNAIAPGFVETEWQKNKPKEIRENIYKKTAIKRFASVEEIADAVRFCIQNSFVNGSIIEVSGGYSYK